MPPVFLAHAFNDGCQNSLVMARALKDAGVEAELHLFREGGHGFGVRRTGGAADQWQPLFLRWMNALGHMDPPPVRDYVDALAEAIRQDAPLPLFPWQPGAEAGRDGFLAPAYRAQSRWTRLHMPSGIGGFKGAGASAAAQASMNIREPLVGVLPANGALSAESSPVLSLAETGPLAVETELGYRLAIDLGYEILNERQTREAVAAIVPVIELPRRRTHVSGQTTVMDTVASNIGSHLYIVGKDHSPESLDPNQTPLRLTKDGEPLHDTSGAAAAGGQWQNLMKILNRLTANGHTIPAGALVISGALGGVHPAEPGRYEASFGPLGTISMEINR